MVTIKSRDFCKLIENQVNKITSTQYGAYCYWLTEEGKCFVPFFDMVEIYENEAEFIEVNAH